MSKPKSDVFAAIAAMDPDKENAARLAGLEKPQPIPFTAPVLPLGEPSAETNCPACDSIRSEQELAAALIAAREAHAPFLENHAPPLESHRASIELRSFEWRLRPATEWQPVTLPHYGGPIGRHTAEYRTVFELPEAVRAKEAQMLRFTGVDYKAHVFLNGTFVGSHEGFFAPFEFDITPHLRAGANELLVLVENDAITRGNQSWHQDAEGEKLYAATFLGWDEPELAWHHCPPGMGIWGRVLIEGRSAAHLGDLFVRPLLDEAQAEICFEIFNTSTDYATGLTVDFSIYGRNFREVRCERVPTTWPECLGPNRNLLKVRIPFADVCLLSQLFKGVREHHVTYLTALRPTSIQTKGNGKIERWDKSFEIDCILLGTLPKIRPLLHLIAKFVEHKNAMRPHSCIAYIILWTNFAANNRLSLRPATRNSPKSSNKENITPKTRLKQSDSSNRYQTDAEPNISTHTL